MNKIIFIGLAFFMLGSMGAKAQTNDEDPFNPITFVDANGNTVADGSHLRVSAAEDVWGGVQASTGLYVNNTSEDEVMTAMKVDSYLRFRYYGFYPNGMVARIFYKLRCCKSKFNSLLLRDENKRQWS